MTVCLAQEHNIMSPARARTQTAHYRVVHTNHEATTTLPNKMRGSDLRWTSIPSRGSRDDDDDDETLFNLGIDEVD